jgi:hypothetical protein
MAGPWTSPADVRVAVRKKWDSGAVPLRGPSAREIGARLADVQQWAASWSRPGPFRVEYKQVGGRKFGANSIPARAWADQAGHGFRRKPRYVRFRAGLAGFTELTVRADEFSVPAARGADRVRDRERDHLPGVSPARRRDGDMGKRLRGART